VDWREAGVTRKQAVDWWNRHKAADQARREREAREKAEQERNDRLKRSGLKKLTAAERRALGIE
jgi:hypothetical protein